MIALRPLWSWGVVGLLGFVSLLAFIRDEALPPNIEPQYKALALLPHWAWGWWALILSAALLFVILEGSYRAHEELDERRQEVDDKLRDVGLERCLSYYGFNPFIHIVGNGTYNFSPVLEIENTGAKTIKYSVTSISVDVNGTPPPAYKPVYSGGILAPTKRGQYNFPSITNVGISPLPIVITLKYVMEYDNIPPIKLRKTEKEMKFEYHSLAPIFERNYIIQENES